MIEKSSNKLINSRKQSLLMRSGLVCRLFVLLIAVALTGGVTNAWFTSGDNEENLFVAGTLNLDVDNNGIVGESETLTGYLNPGECLENQYAITNTGSKRMYLRASFEGLWKRIYHRNIASATAEATFNGQTITVSDSDQAHYYFGDFGSSLPPTFTSEATQGFSADYSPTPLVVETDFNSSSNSTNNSINLQEWNLESAASTSEVTTQSISLTNQVPTVNGLFYGDGDYLVYKLFGIGQYGSKLYYYLHETNPGQPDNRYILYGSKVVDRYFNDNVFDGDVKPGPGGQLTDYMISADWEVGRRLFQLVNSEYVEFSLKTCNNTWTWKQGYVLDRKSNIWESGLIGGGTPPSYVAGSSIAWNINNSNWVTGGPGSVVKSPFLPEYPDDVTKVDGYPESGQITYSERYQWEWPMVYEFSVDLTDALSTCEYKTIELLTGLSHHSPSKEGPENENFTTYDWGDLPDRYLTRSVYEGPRHKIIINGAYLGTQPDPEYDGQPHGEAIGDDLTDFDDEDGIIFLTPMIPGSTALIQVTAGTAGYLSAWIDFNGDGNLTKINLVSANGPGTLANGLVGDLHIPESGVYIFEITVPEDTLTLGNIYSRWRYTNLAGQGGNSITGLATTGEIEDHMLVATSPPAIELKKYVSLDGGLSWIDADELSDQIILDPAYQPQFKFVVTNTGGVELSNIVVTDNVFGDIFTLGSLGLGQSYERVIPDTFWDTQLLTSNVTVDLCDDEENWVLEKDGYYYFVGDIGQEVGIIGSQQTVSLCIKICLAGDTGAIYDGAQFTLYSYFEAVQTTNGLVDGNWLGHPF